MSLVAFYHLSVWSLPEILLILLIFQLSFLRNTARHNKNFVVNRQNTLIRPFKECQPAYQEVMVSIVFHCFIQKIDKHQ